MTWNEKLFGAQDQVRAATKRVQELRESYADSSTIPDDLNRAFTSVAAVENMLAKSRKPDNQTIARAIRRTIGEISVLPESAKEALHDVEKNMVSAHSLFDSENPVPDAAPLPGAASFESREAARAQAAPQEQPAP